MAQNVIRRSQWGARYRDGFRSRPMPISEYWLHHSVTIAPDLLPPFSDDDKAVRTLESIGQSRFGGGISYTYPVTPVGRIYEGHSLDRQGAHTKGHNTVGAAFCLVGNYDKQAPTAAQELAIATRMVEDHRNGDSTTHQLNGGHRDTFATSCPGNRAYPRIPHINRLAREMWAGKNPAGSGGGGASGGVNVPDPTQHQQEDSMSAQDVTALKDWFEDYFTAVLVGGYAVDGKKFPGIAAVDIENQRRITNLSAEVTALGVAVRVLAQSKGANPQAIADEVAKAVKERLAQITVNDDGGTQ